MALTNAEILALPEYTDAEMVKLLRFAITRIAGGGQARGIDGRQLTEADLPKLTAALEFFEARVNVAEAEADLNDNDGVAYAVFRPSL